MMAIAMFPVVKVHVHTVTCQFENIRVNLIFVNIRELVLSRIQSLHF